MEACGSRTYCLKNRPFFRVIVCTVTLVAFLFTVIPPDITWALTNDFRPPVTASPVNSSNIAIPESLGTIKDSWKEPRVHGSGPTIIHIQDAHCNYYAQHKIADIIKYLNDNYDITSINLEGGAGDYDLSVFKGIKDTAAREKVVDRLLKEGVLNGAEYFAANNPEKVSLWGIEETKLYIENLRAYRDSLSYKDDVNKSLKSLNYALSNLKTKIYSRQLLELDRKANAYKEKSPEFKDYIAYLINLSKSYNIDISDLKNISILNKTISLEPGIDFKRANTERDELVDRITKLLSRIEVKELIEKAVEFKLGRLTPIEFYSYLVIKSRELRIDLDVYKNLVLYIGYTQLYSTIKNDQLFKELSILEDSITEKLYQNPTQRELYRLSKNLSIIKNIFGITLTPDEYRYYKGHQDEFELENYVNFVNSQAPLHGFNFRCDKDILKLDDYLERIEKFYAFSLKRDQAFLKNLRMESKKSLAATSKTKAARDDHYGTARQQIAIMVTGGFHTENLAELFKKNNISYVSVMPNFRDENGYECPYFDLLAGKNNKILSALTPNASTLALYTYFCPDSADVYNTADLNTAVRRRVNAISTGSEEAYRLSAAGSEEPPSGAGQDQIAQPAVVKSHKDGLFIYIMKRLVGAKFSARQEEIIREEAKEVVDILLPDKSVDEKTKISRELTQSAVPLSLPVIFLGALAPLANGAVLSVMSVISGIIGTLTLICETTFSIEPSFDYTISYYLMTFTILYSCFMLLSLLLHIDPHVVAPEKFMPRRRGILEKRILEFSGRKEGQVYLLPFMPPSYFRRIAAHEFTHHLYGFGHHIETDLPVASAMGTLRRFETGKLSGEDKKDFNYGFKIMMNKTLDPQERYENLVNQAKRRGKYTPGTRYEHAFTYSLGRSLAGYGYALSLETGKPGDLRKFIYILSKGISPVVAERAIRRDSPPSAAGSEAPQASMAVSTLPSIESKDNYKKVAWFESAKYMRWVSWWLEPMVAFGVAAPIWAILVYYGAGVWAGSAAAVIFWMPYMFRGRRVFLSKEVLGLTAGTAITGSVMFGLGFFSVPSLSFLAILTLAHVIVNRRAANTLKPTKRMGWTKAISLALIASIIFSSFLIYNGLRLVGEGFSPRHALQFPNPIEKREPSTLTPALYREIDKTIEKGKADRIFWERLFGNYSNERQVRDIVTLEIIKRLYETKQLDHLFNGLRKFPPLLYRYLSEMPEDEHRQFARYFATLKPGTRQQVFHIFYYRLRNDLMVLENAGTVKFLLEPFAYKRLAAQSHRMENLYASMVQILNRKDPLRTGELPQESSAPLPLMGFTREQAIGVLYGAMEKVVREYHDKGYKITLPSANSVNIRQLSGLIGYYGPGWTFGDTDMHYRDNKAALLLEWVMGQDHRVTDGELFAEAMKLYVNDKEKSIDLFGALATIGHYYKSMARSTDLVLGGLGAKGRLSGAEYMRRHHDQMLLAAPMDSGNERTVNENGAPTIRWKSVDEDGNISDSKEEPLPTDGAIYHSWGFVFNLAYMKRMTISQITNSGFIQFLRDGPYATSHLGTTDIPKLMPYYRYLYGLGLEKAVVVATPFGFTKGFIGEGKSISKLVFADAVDRLFDLADEAGIITFVDEAPNLDYCVSPSSRMIEGGMGIYDYHKKLMARWQHSGCSNFVEWGRKDPKAFWKFVMDCEELQALHDSYYPADSRLELPFEPYEVKNAVKKGLLNAKTFYKYGPSEKWKNEIKHKKGELTNSELEEVEKFNSMTQNELLDRVLLMNSIERRDVFVWMAGRYNAGLPMAVMLVLMEDKDLAEHEIGINHFYNYLFDRYGYIGDRMIKMRRQWPKYQEIPYELLLKLISKEHFFKTRNAKLTKDAWKDVPITGDPVKDIEAFIGMVEGEDGKVINSLNPLPEARKLLLSGEFTIDTEIAGNPAIRDILEKLIIDGKPEIRESIARNPHTPEDILRKISGDKDTFVLRSLARNPVCPQDILKVLTCDLGLYRYVASNPGASIDNLKTAIKGLEIEDLIWLAKNPSTTPKTLHLLTAREDEDLWKELAKNPNTQAKTLEILEKNPDIRKYVAGNPNTPIDKIRKYASNPEFHAYVADNPSLPVDILVELASSEDKYVRCGVASNPVTPETMVRKLLNDPHEWVREAAAKNLEKRKMHSEPTKGGSLDKQSDQTKREYLASHKETVADTLVAMTLSAAAGETSRQSPDTALTDDRISQKEQLASLYSKIGIDKIRFMSREEMNKICLENDYEKPELLNGLTLKSGTQVYVVDPSLKKGSISFNEMTDKIMTDPSFGEDARRQIVMSAFHEGFHAVMESKKPKTTNGERLFNTFGNALARIKIRKSDRQVTGLPFVEYIFGDDRELAKSIDHNESISEEHRAAQSYANFLSTLRRSNIYRESALPYEESAAFILETLVADGKTTLTNTNKKTFNDIAVTFLDLLSKEQLEGLVMFYKDLGIEVKIPQSLSSKFRSAPSRTSSSGEAPQKEGMGLELDSAPSLKLSPPAFIAGFPVIWTGGLSKDGLRIACAQIRNERFLVNADKIKKIVMDLNKLGQNAPDLVLFPEFTSTYHIGMNEERIIDRLQAIADESNIAIGYSIENIPPSKEAEDVMVTYYVIYPAKSNNRTQRFRKYNSQNENRTFVVNGRTISIMICREADFFATSLNGKPDNTQLSRYINTSDILVLPSDSTMFNSHASVEKLCRVFGKPVIFLNAAGTKPTGTSFAWWWPSSYHYVSGETPLPDNEAILMVDVPETLPPAAAGRTSTSGKSATSTAAELQMGYKKLLNSCMLDESMIHVLRTECNYPLVSLMGNHSGSNNTWELARLLKIIKRPGILIRLDDHDDLMSIYEKDLASPRYSNVEFTVPAVYYGLIDEIYLVENTQKYGPATYEASLYEGTTRGVGRLVGVTYPPRDGKEHFPQHLNNIKVIKKIKIHIITDPSQMPDLSKDPRPVLWDNDADWYFFARSTDIDSARLKLTLAREYLKRINRLPDVVTNALSSETTGQMSGIYPNCHAEFLTGWVDILRDAGVKFVCDPQGVPIATNIESLRTPIFGINGAPAAGEDADERRSTTGASDTPLLADNVDTINAAKIPQDKPVMAVFDVHGTLFQPNWKEVYERTYLKLVNKLVTKQWIKDHIWQKTEAAIIDALAEESGENIEYVEATLAEMRDKIWDNEVPLLVPGALELVKALKARGIPMFIVSRSYTNNIIKQLKKTGFLEYIPVENIVGRQREVKIDYNRVKMIEAVRAHYPNHTLAYFDDWTEAIGKLGDSAACFGIAQGEGEEFDYNYAQLKDARPNYIIKRQYGWKALDKFLTVPAEVQLKDEKTPVAKDLARELPVVLPALRHDHIGLHIDVSDDLESITYSIVEPGSEVFKWDGTVDYNALKLRELIKVPSTRLITPKRYLEENLRGETRETLLRLLSEGKRYTRYKGITTTWDANVDKDAWTTNIDTAFMHKRMEELGIFERADIKSVIEIGVGGGHLSAALAARLPNLRQISITDISLYALRAAKRCIEPYLALGSRLRCYLGKGIKTVEGGADLVVVNPPYIPTPPFIENKEGDPYRGTGLVREILKEGIGKLNKDNPEAQILINISSLTQKDWDRYCEEFKDYLTITPTGPPLEVPLKIWTIASTPEWTNWLVQEGGLKFNPHAKPGEEPYTHTIQVYSIKPKLKDASILNSGAILQGDTTGRTSATGSNEEFGHEDLIREIINIPPDEVDAYFAPDQPLEQMPAFVAKRLERLANLVKGSNMEIFGWHNTSLGNLRTIMEEGLKAAGVFDQVEYNLINLSKPKYYSRNFSILQFLALVVMEGSGTFGRVKGTADHGVILFPFMSLPEEDRKFFSNFVPLNNEPIPTSFASARLFGLEARKLHPSVLTSLNMSISTEEIQSFYKRYLNRYELPYTKENYEVRLYIVGVWLDRLFDQLSSTHLAGRTSASGETPQTQMLDKEFVRQHTAEELIDYLIRTKRYNEEGFIREYLLMNDPVKLSAFEARAIVAHTLPKPNPEYFKPLYKPSTTEEVEIESQIKQIVHDDPGLVDSIPVIRELIRQNGNIENMSGQKGIELGTLSRLECLKHLRSRNINVEAVSADFNGAEGTHTYLHKVTEYNDFFGSGDKSEQYDFIYARRSLYFSVFVPWAPVKNPEAFTRAELIAARYIPLNNALKNGGLIISIYGLGEEEELLTEDEMERVGFENVRRCYVEIPGEPDSFILSTMRKKGLPIAGVADEVAAWRASSSGEAPQVEGADERRSTVGDASAIPAAALQMAQASSAEIAAEAVERIRNKVKATGVSLPTKVRIFYQTTAGNQFDASEYGQPISFSSSEQVVAKEIENFLHQAMADKTVEDHKILLRDHVKGRYFIEIYLIIPASEYCGKISYKPMRQISIACDKTKGMVQDQLPSTIHKTGDGTQPPDEVTAIGDTDRRTSTSGEAPQAKLKNYVDINLSIPKGLGIVIPSLRTHSIFFRHKIDKLDNAAFNTFINKMAHEAKKGNKVRILSAGCSTGEEVYTIILSLLKKGVQLDKFEVVGIDKDPEMISKAIKGIYDAIAAPYNFNNPLLKKYFSETESGEYKVKAEIRNSAKFQTCDLTDTAKMESLGLFDGVICMTVLYQMPEGIGKDNDKKSMACKSIAKVTKEDGLLLTDVNKDRRIFVRKDSSPTGFKVSSSDPKAVKSARSQAAKRTSTSGEEEGAIPGLPTEPSLALDNTGSGENDVRDAKTFYQMLKAVCVVCPKLQGKAEIIKYQLGKLNEEAVFVVQSWRRVPKAIKTIQRIIESGTLAHNVEAKIAQKLDEIIEDVGIFGSRKISGNLLDKLEPFNVITNEGEEVPAGQVVAENIPGITRTSTTGEAPEYLLNKVEKFFAEGYRVSYSRWEDDDDLPIPADEIEKLKYDGNSRFAVIPHNNDDAKFAVKHKPGHVRLDAVNGGIVKIGRIEPNLPARHGYGMTCAMLAALLLYGDSDKELKFFIQYASQDVLDSISKFGIFNIDVQPIPSAPDNRYNITGTLPHIDSDTLKRWRMMNEPTGERNSASGEALKSYVTRIYGTFKELLARTRQPEEPRYVFMPLPEALREIRSEADRIMITKSVEKSLDQAQEITNAILKNNGFTGINIEFYDGRVDDLKRAISAVSEKKGNVTASNGLAYIDKDELAKLSDADRKALGVTTVKENIPKDGGMMTVGGHVVLALGVLDLFNNDRAEDSDYWTYVLDLVRKISNNERKYEGITKDDFLETIKKGDLEIDLPPIEKERIDQNMRTLSIVEKAVGTSM